MIEIDKIKKLLKIQVEYHKNDLFKDIDMFKIELGEV
jgi:hypothetical protein